MEHNEKRAEPSIHAHPVVATTEDTRKPYEAPKLLKKRSVARATLVTAMGPTTSGLTMMG